MTIRSKMQLTEIHNLHWSPTMKRLKFQATYDSTIPEDQRFQMATPSASAEYLIDNPAALAQFTMGEYYYVDFTPVNAETKATASESIG